MLARRLHCQSCWVLQPAEPRGFVREASPWVYRCRLCCFPPVPPGEKNGRGRKDSHLKRFFWAHWNILFICFIKNNQLFSSFFSQSQHSEKTVVTESQLAFIVFKVLERKKLCGWVVMTFCSQFAQISVSGTGCFPNLWTSPLCGCVFIANMGLVTRVIWTKLYLPAWSN